ncbi:hypothetical protein [Parapedobacter pyrenivorans]|uniref:hypothetical protein n=1 Tax=Parapedobacter pyrenivorans TaxID=1305674 RepID=UPI003340E17D
MKTKKPKWRHFNHLTKEEFENPLLPLLELCCSATSLEYHRSDIHHFARASCCHNTGFSPVDFSEMYFLYKQLSNHIELLYLLMHRYSEWQISLTSPLYQCEVQGLSKIIHDDDMFGGTTMHFEALSKAEFMDLSVFMNNFFKFKSLRSWRETMQELIEAIFSDESFSQYQHDAQQVFQYLDKLGEAAFLAYELHGKAYMLEHHADRFGIKRKKLVDIEPTTTIQ